MLKIYRVNKVDWQGKDCNLKSFLDNEKAQSYLKQCQNLNKIEKIVIREETVYQR